MKRKPQEYWRKPCAYCGTVFLPSEKRVICCSRRCSAKWKWAQPGYAAKVAAGVDVVKRGEAIRAAILANPKEMARRKRTAAQYGRLSPGWKSGSIVTRAELVLRGLFPNAKPNHKIATGLSSKKHQAHYYKLDLAWPSVKLDVEVDGSYHDMTVQRDKDFHRDQFMSRNGWFVLRVKNSEVMGNPSAVKASIETLLVKLQSR